MTESWRTALEKEVPMAVFKAGVVGLAVGEKGKVCFHNPSDVSQVDEARSGGRFLIFLRNNLLGSPVSCLPSAAPGRRHPRDGMSRSRPDGEVEPTKVRRTTKNTN